MVSTYTTEDLPGETVPSIVPAETVTATADMSNSVNRKRGIMNNPFEVCAFSTTKQLIHPFQPGYGCIGMKWIECHWQSGYWIGGYNDGL
jgi:hypothetical protein